MTRRSTAEPFHSPHPEERTLTQPELLCRNTQIPSDLRAGESHHRLVGEIDDHEQHAQDHDSPCGSQPHSRWIHHPGRTSRGVFRLRFQSDSLDLRAIGITRAILISARRRNNTYGPIDAIAATDTSHRGVRVRTIRSPCRRRHTVSTLKDKAHVCGACSCPTWTQCGATALGRSTPLAPPTTSSSLVSSSFPVGDVPDESSQFDGGPEVQ